MKGTPPKLSGHVLVRDPNGGCRGAVGLLLVVQGNWMAVGVLVGEPRIGGSTVVAPETMGRVGVDIRGGVVPRNTRHKAHYIKLSCDYRRTIKIINAQRMLL